MMTKWHTVAILTAFMILLALVSALCGCPRQADEIARPTTTTVEGTATTTTLAVRIPSFPNRINGLDQPVAMAFAPDGRIFITERAGKVRVFEDGELKPEPFVTVDVPRLVGYHETGLLGIATHPNFKAQPYVYIYYTFSENGRLFNRVERYRFGSGGQPRPDVLIDRIPAGRIHDGGILAFGPDGNLYISTGETGQGSLAQNQQPLAGKILRITPEGGIPSDNPFPGSPVYSLGHRNVFGLAFQPGTGALYATENGPAEDDEINKIEAGKNYGWPNVLGRSNNPRYVNPIITYTPPIAPTQAVFYTGNEFKSIRNKLIFGAYITGELYAVDVGNGADNQQAQSEVVFRSDEPIIDVAQSPSGDLYITKSDSIVKVERLSD